jgi:hypothetical protein
MAWAFLARSPRIHRFGDSSRNTLLCRQPATPIARPAGARRSPRSPTESHPLDQEDADDISTGGSQSRSPATHTPSPEFFATDGTRQGDDDCETEQENKDVVHGAPILRAPRFTTY